MSDFGLDLGAIEEEMDSAGDGRVVLGILDGETPGEEWIDVVGRGDVLVLSIEGNLEELAGEFAGEIDEAGGSLVHFRDFLVVTPPNVSVDTDRL
jgi:hypothetical protein